jgi:hypothetical protein
VEVGEVFNEKTEDLKGNRRRKIIIKGEGKNTVICKPF